MKLNYPASLPISSRREEIINAVRRHQVTIVAGDTGSGKTTQLPKMCLEAGRGRQRRIGCTQPRRLAAITVAERLASEIKERWLVGYRIRFADHTSDKTRIQFMTDGILLAETASSPRLDAYDTIILDEAHERSLNIDFLIGYLTRLLRQRRDLKLIISSATIDTEKFATHFDKAPVIEVTGRTHPITIRYRPAGDDDDEGDGYVERAVTEVKKLLAAPGGDILVFMPTERDIRETLDLLREEEDTVLTLPLFGRLQTGDQRRVFLPGKKRKVIVATNVAETSVTIPGIRYVVDTGLARISRYNARAKTTSLRVSRISRASCDQRAGRCGRTGPGVCIRLFGEEDYLRRAEYTQPEIKRANLAEVILRMIHLRLGDPRKFPFMDPPASRAISDAYGLLRELKALTPQNSLTKYGKIMARLPLDPCLSRILIEARHLGALRECKVIVAALACRDPRIRPAEREEKADRAHARFAASGSDFLSLLAIWQAGPMGAGNNRSGGALRRFCRSHFLSWQRMREWIDIHDQLHLALKREKSFTDNRRPAPADAVHRAVTSGFLRNIGLRKKKNIYRISGDREVMIFPGSALFNQGSDWIVAASFVETSRLFARLCAAVDPEWLEGLGGPLCRRSWSDPRWDKKSGRVMAMERVTLYGLPIVSGRRVDYARTTKANRKEARSIFIHTALINGGLGGRYRFLKTNRQRLKEMTDLEERIRRRGLAPDDMHLAALYDQRLGSDVVDRASLQADIEKHGGDDYLLMSLEDIRRRHHDQRHLFDYPEYLQVPEKKYTFRLEYLFQPGHEADGVTVVIPVHLVAGLDHRIFEWLVPGLLPEKITLLLRSLPKKLRRSLVPIPQSVDTLLDSLDTGRGSLYQALEKAIFKLYHVAIKRGDWKVDALPPHLKFRFRVVDAAGKTVGCFRSFRDMTGSMSRQSSGSGKDGAGRPSGPGRWEKEDISVADLDRIRKSISLADPSGGAPRIFTPILVAATHPGQVDLRYVENIEEYRDHARRGLRRLYLRQFPRQKKMLLRECAREIRLHSASWLLLGSLKESNRTASLLANYILDDIFALTSPEPAVVDRRTFERRVEKIREQGLLSLSIARLERISGILAARRRVLETMSRFRDSAKKHRHFQAERFQCYRRHLDEILPADFLTSSSYERLAHTDRYLRGLEIRMERAEYSPAKDEAKMRRLVVHRDRLKNFSETARTPSCRRHLEEYRLMFEEFRLSIFAPELGTAQPVSARKLEDKWRRLKDGCRRME